VILPLRILETQIDQWIAGMQGLEQYVSCLLCLVSTGLTPKWPAAEAVHACHLTHAAVSPGTRRRLVVSGIDVVEIRVKASTLQVGCGLVDHPV
jgi:hypothetical protein